MKNFIFATISSLALIVAVEVNAQRNDQKTPAASSSTTLDQTTPTQTQATSSTPKALSQRNQENPYNKPKWDTQANQRYVVYPPLDERGQPMSTPSYYEGNPQSPYQYYEGYFWYPQAQGNLLVRYTPYYDNRNYWYPSHMHPHKVYVERAPLAFTYPHPLDAPMYEQQARPMEKKWESAPEMHSAEDY